jgi:hypothetical protein
MARSRNIKPGFFANEHLATLPPITRLLFIGLWTLADRDGRLEDRPTKIKMQLFAADDVDVSACLTQLAEAGEPFIRRYVVDGVAVIQIVNWDAHQKPHHQEASSGLPPMPSATELDSHQGANPVRTKVRSEIAPRCERDSHQGAKRGKEVRGNQERGDQGKGDRERGERESGIGDQGRTLLGIPADRGLQSVTPENVFDYFRASNAATKPTKLSNERRKKLQTRLRATDWPWREAIDKLPIPNDAKFTFQPDLDWLIENDTNARKLAEGRYDARSGGNAQTQNNLAAVEAFANGR